jgi:hypothetical protein
VSVANCASVTRSGRSIAAHRSFQMKKGHDDDPPAVRFEDPGRRDVGDATLAVGLICPLPPLCW